MIHSVRLIPPCMMTGEAAGAAAALCVKRNIEPRELPYEDLRKKLAADGALLED